MRGQQAKKGGSIFDVMASEISGLMRLNTGGGTAAAPAELAALERQCREMSERIISE